MRRALAAILFLLSGSSLPLIPFPALAQSTTEAEGELQTIEAKSEKGASEAETLKKDAERLAAEILGLQKDMVASAQAIRKAETEVAALEKSLMELGLRQAEIRNRLAAERDWLGQSLIALARLSQRPQAALLVTQRPIDNARSALLLGWAAPVFDRRARYFAAALADLTASEAAANKERGALAARLLELAAENRHLGDLIAQKSNLAQAARKAEDEKSQELAKLAQQAKDLKDLINRLQEAETAAAAAAEEPAAEPATLAAAPTVKPTIEEEAAAAIAQRPKDLRPFPTNGDGTIAPVKGQIFRRFGESAEAATSRGIEIATAPGARILSPFAGQIVFEGPFRSYGKMLIIEHAGGYHTVLAGLDEVDVGLGQWLLTGEPVGRMTSLKDEPPHLYIELRRNGDPIDPVPILALGSP